MINRLAEVSTINYSLSGNPIIPSIREQQQNGEYLDCMIPTSFQYNGVWSISHLCTSCENTITFQDLPKQNYKHINRLFSKFYAKEFLEAIANIFPGTKVIKSNNSDYHFLTNVKFEGNIVSDLFIPQKAFAYYSCSECQAEYLCQIRHGYPMEANRGNTAGKLGTIYIDDIGQVHMEDDKMKFSDVLEKYRKA
ncbi:MAG: hypothetical protein P1U56_15065 [Saprospiraceae bacterium]|nr:hypothetical protein [Saprospiraceae bacterium]